MDVLTLAASADRMLCIRANAAIRDVGQQALHMAESHQMFIDDKADGSLWYFFGVK